MRKYCEMKGCKNLAIRKGRRKSGAVKYGKLCQTHHKKKYGIVRNRWQDKEIQEMSKQPCSKCGWNESYCDRHRVIPHTKGGRYVKGNVVPLCPNCHRVE